MSSSRSEVRDPETYCDVCCIQFLQRDTFLGHKRYYCGNARRSRAESALPDLVGPSSTSAAASAAGTARDPPAPTSSSADPNPYPNPATGAPSHPQSPHSKSSHSPTHVTASGPHGAGGKEASGGSHPSSEGHSPTAAPTLDFLNPLLLMQSLAQLYSQTQTRPQQLLEPPASSAATGESQSATLEQLNALSEQLKLQLQGFGVPPTAATNGATESSSSAAAAASVVDAHKYQLPEALATGSQGAGYPGVFLPGAPLMIAAPVLTAYGLQYYPVMQTPLTLGSLIAGLDSQTRPPPPSPSLPLPVPGAAHQLLPSHSNGPGPRPGPVSPSSERESMGPHSRRSESPPASPLAAARAHQQTTDPNALQLQQLLQSFRALDPLNTLFSAAAGVASKASPTSTSLISESNAAPSAFIKQELLENYVSQHLRSHSEPQPLSVSVSGNHKASASPPTLLQSSSNRPLDLTLKPHQTPASEAVAARHSRSRASSECSDMAVDGKPNATALSASGAAPGASGQNLMEQLLKLYQNWMSSSLAADAPSASSPCGGLPLLWSQAARASELLSQQAASDASAGGDVLPVLLQNSVFFMCTRCLVAFRDLDLLRAHKPQCSETAATATGTATGGKLGASASAAVGAAAVGGAETMPTRPSEDKEATPKEGASPKQQQNFSCVCGIQFSAAESLRAHQTWYCSKTATLDKEASNAGVGAPSRHFRSRSEVRTSVAGATHEQQLHRNTTAADETSAPARRHGVSFLETRLVVGGRREENANGDPKEEPRAEPSAQVDAEMDEVEMVPVKLFTCGVCTHSSRSLESFAEHLKCHPTIAQAVYYQCALCGYRGNTVRGLKIHGKAHCSAGGANFSDDQVQLMCRPDAIAGGISSATVVPKEILQVSTRFVRATELDYRADATAVGGTTRDRDGSFGELLSLGSEHHLHAMHRTRSRRSFTDVRPNYADAANYLAALASAAGSSDSLECPHCQSRFVNALNRENHMRTVCGRIKRAMTVADNRDDSCGAQNAMARKRTHTASTNLNLITAAAVSLEETTNPNPSDQKPSYSTPEPKESAPSASPTGNSVDMAKPAALKVCSRCDASFRNMSNYLAHKQFYCQYRRHTPSRTASSVCGAIADEAESSEPQRQQPPPQQQRSCSECLVSPSVSEAAVGAPVVKRERVSSRSPLATNECADDRCPVPVRYRVVEVVAIEEAAAGEASPPPPKRALQQQQHQQQQQPEEADESGEWPRETRESSTSSASDEHDEQRAARSPAHESVVDVCG